MRIAVLGINFFPETIGIGLYTTEMCEYLKCAGHDVTVFTSFPYYPDWKIKEGYKNKLFMNEDYQGIKIRRSYVYVHHKVTLKTRVLHESSFIISALFNLFFSDKPELLITVSPPLGLGLVALAISKIKGIPFIFHIQDLQPDVAVELGMLKNKSMLRLLYGIEKLIYRKAARISVIGRKMKERVIAKGINEEKVFYFPNWVDTDYIKPMPKINKFRELYKIVDKFIVLYSGNIGIKQGLDVVLEVAKQTKDNKNIIYVIVGNGARREELICKYERLGLENMIFLPLQPKEIFPHVLAAADVSLVPQQKKTKDVFMPSKLLGIMASGRAVIAGASVGTELYTILKDSGGGLIVEPENSGQLLEAIMKLYNNLQEGEEYGRKAREYVVKHFSKINVIESFERDAIIGFTTNKLPQS